MNHTQRPSPHLNFALTPFISRKHLPQKVAVTVLNQVNGVILQKVRRGTSSTQSKIQNGTYLDVKRRKIYFQFFLDQHINSEGFPASWLTELLHVSSREHLGWSVKLTVHLHIRPTLLSFLQSVQASARLVPWNRSDQIISSKTLTYSAFMIKVWSSWELNNVFIYTASFDLMSIYVQIKIYKL
jgi:hypothetical protein